MKGMLVRTDEFEREIRADEHIKTIDNILSDLDELAVQSDDGTVEIEDVRALLMREKEEE